MWDPVFKLVFFLYKPTKWLPHSPGAKAFQTTHWLFHKLTPQFWPHFSSNLQILVVLSALLLSCSYGSPDPFRSKATLSQTLLGLKCNRNPTPYPNPSYLLTPPQPISTVFTFPHCQGHCSASCCIPSPGTTCTARSTNKKYPRSAQSTKSTWNSPQSWQNPFSGLTTPTWPSAKTKRDGVSHYPQGSKALRKDTRLKPAQLDVSRIIFHLSIHVCVWERVLACSPGWPWTDSSCFCLPSCN